MKRVIRNNLTYALARYLPGADVAGCAAKSNRIKQRHASGSARVRGSKMRFSLSIYASLDGESCKGDSIAAWVCFRYKAY
jgi:hypothetical protein